MRLPEQSTLLPCFCFGPLIHEVPVWSTRGLAARTSRLPAGLPSDDPMIQPIAVDPVNPIDLIRSTEIEIENELGSDRLADRIVVIIQWAEELGRATLELAAPRRSAAVTEPGYRICGGQGKMERFES